MVSRFDQQITDAVNLLNRIDSYLHRGERHVTFAEAVALLTEARPYVQFKLNGMRDIAGIERLNCDEPVPAPNADSIPPEV